MMGENFHYPMPDPSAVPSVLEGKLDATGLRFSIIVSRFNSFVTERLLEGALDALRRSGADFANVEVIRIPGSWEMGVTAAAVARTHRADAIICLGTVIRGETPHFDYVAGEAAKSLGNIASHHGIPVAFGVLTTETLDQAINRAGGKSGNKGFEAAMTAVEMANLLRQLAGN